jgi:hypothetical protein
MEAIIWPVSPLVGVLVFHPLGAVNDSNVVSLGVFIDRTTFPAEAGPRFVTDRVNVSSCSGATGSGVALTVMARSEADGVGVGNGVD